ncbi:MAG: hypothetical protein AAF658_16175, partial [Myxococcota bacterium]
NEKDRGAGGKNCCDPRCPKWNQQEWFAHATFVRAHARTMTLAAVASNALLLIPFRTPWIAAVLAAGAAIFLILRDGRWHRDAPELRTPEGRWARGLLFVPPILIAARAVNLYPVDATFFAILSLGAAAFATCWSLTRDQFRLGGGYVAMAAVVVSAVCAGLAVEPVLATSLAILTVGLGAAGLILGLGRLLPEASRVATPVSVILAVSTTLLAGWFGQSATASAIGLAVGIAASTYGYLTQRGAITFVGLIQIAGSAVFLWRNAVDEYGMATWGGLAVVGVLTVMATSFLERWQRTRQDSSAFDGNDRERHLVSS